MRETLAGDGILLPDPLPLAGIKPFARQSTAYVSKIDPASLIEAARRDLGTNPARQEEWKIVLLAFTAGLRKRGIDTLLWRQVDTNRGTIRIETTEFFRPKSKDSHAEVDLDPEVGALLDTMKDAATGAFVIESPLKPREVTYGASYRCDPVFNYLNAWLRAQGITARKPLHELRKEVGSLVARDGGLYDAQKLLRHASPATTAALYLDKKKRISAGLGALIAPTVAKQEVQTDYNFSGSSKPVAR